MNSKFVLCLSLLMLFGFPPANAQEKKFPPDHDLVGSSHYEGIRTHTDVSAGTLTLKSFIGRTSTADADDSSPKFKVGWYVPQNLADREIDLLIEDRPRSRYYMKPLQSNWSSGFQIFSWDGSRVAKQNNIRLSELFGVAKSKSGKEIIPLIFFNSEQPGSVEIYEFVFVANLTATVRFTVTDMDENKLKPVETRQDQPKNSHITLKLNCSNLSTGKYLLFVEYFMKSGGEMIRDEDTYEFYHKK